MAEALPGWLVDYMRKRDQQRADEVNSVLAALTDRERRLVREAAVMGYVHGRQHPAGADHPKDSTVVANVIAACLSNSDLYLVLSGVRPCGECGHPKYNHRDDGEDPVTPGTCLQCEAEGAEDDACHDYQRKD